MGVEPATGADEQEEKRDFRSASARGRAAKADGVIAEAQAGDSPRLHHSPLIIATIEQESIVYKY